MNIQQKLTNAFLGVLIVTGTLFATEGEESKDDRIPVGEREMTLVERVAHRETLAKEKGEEGKEAKPRSATIKRSVQTPRTTYYSSHEGALHNAIAVSLYGETVELEDGSMWSVHSLDRHKIFSWLTSDLVIIAPNANLFSCYEYKLINANTGDYVEVSLTLGPIYKGLYTHWVLAIDHFSSEVILEDGSVWSMAFSDSLVTNKWLIADTVIMGINDGILSSMYPNILINVNTNSYARGNCIN